MITKDKKKRVGALKQRVIFQREERVSDGMGNTFPQWVDDFNAWADIRPLNSSQRLQLDAVNQSVTHTIKIRHRSNESLKGRRIKYGDRLLNIHGYINEGEERVFDELTAAEILQPV